MSRVSSLFKWIQRQENRAAAESRRAPLLVHSPVDRDTLHRETSRRDRWITKEEAERLLLVTPAPLQFAVAAGMFGGFRIGEVLHLRTYVDVDLSLETITIAPKQVGVDAEGRAEWWKPKTPRAARVVPVAPDLMPILERQVMSFASDHWLMPALADETRPYGYHSFRASFALIVADAEMVTGRADPRGVTYHTLRHTFASWLVMEGIDLYTVAQLLGDTLQMVEKTYAHMAPDYKRRAIEALKGVVRMPDTAARNDTASATTGEK
jgi:integrase